MLTRLPALGRRDDDGIAMVTSIALVGLVTLMIAALLTITLRESRQTGHNRQRASAVSSAEGAVDLAVSQIHDMDPAALPCGSSTVSNNLSKPDKLAITTTVTYYDTSGAALSCGAVTNPTSGIAAAGVLIRSSSVATTITGTQPAQRTVETYMRLSPEFAKDLDKAIFGNNGITLSNKATIQGSSPEKKDADVYTNGNFTCSNNVDIAGSVYAQGRIDLDNTCKIDVHAWAKTGFGSTSPGATVSGNVMVSNGTANISKGTIGGLVKAPTITPASFCSSNPGKCVTGAGVVTDPPALAFPQLNWDATVQAAWAAAPGNFTNVVTNNTCGTGSGSVSEWIYKNAPKLTSPTIVRTTCAVVISNPGSTPECGNKVLCLGNNLAVFADGGVTMSQTLSIRSTDSATLRNLYLIQPYNAVSTHPCTTTAITLDNQVTIESTVNELLYTPCGIRKANNSDHYGQIYAGGTATFDNQLNMQFRPLPVWGVNGTTNKVTHYEADILYKRETR